MVVNRVSDLAFLIGIMALYYTFRSVDFSTVFSTVDAFVNTTILFGPLAVSPITLIAFLLFVGAMGKSAQIGLHT
jgi:NADH-quinone oxidoreductase subunit L